MTIAFPRSLLAALTLTFLSASALSQVAQQPGDPIPPTPPVRTRHAMVVSIQHDATDAGVEILRAGGNGVDAAVAVGFALAVVHPAAGNIGGGGFMLIRPGADRFALAARENMYLDTQGNVIPKMSMVGPNASGVPGSVAGFAYAEKHFGKLGLARVMQPAIRLARDGFTLTDEEAGTLDS